MATRFHLVASGTAPATPAYDTNWEQTGEASRLPLLRKTTNSLITALANSQVTIPITTTQDILNKQFVSEYLPPQVIVAGIVGIVVRCSENATTNNAHLAFSLRVVNDDGTIRGTLASSFTTISEFALHAAQATRIIGNGTTTAVTTGLTTLPGDRLVLEIGVRANGPTAAGNAQQRFGNSATSDFAQTTALTTDLNPWMEISDDLWPILPNNYQFVRVGDGMGCSERIR